jgi:hypothetical protein
MTKRTQETYPETIELSRQCKRVVRGQVDAANMTSNAGVMLLSEVDCKLGLTQV